MIKRIAIFGGSGFIGTNLIKYLSSKNHDIVNFDIEEPDESYQNCTFKYLDIRDIENDYDFLSDYDFVYILSALLGRRCFNEPDNGWNTNILGTTNLIQKIAQLQDSPTMVFSSSAMVYDNHNCIVPLVESNQLKAETLYEQSKVIGELLLESCCNVFGSKAIVFRFFTVYGPGPASFFKGHFIPTWILQAKNHAKLSIYDDGKQTIDLTHVQDVVKSLASVIDYNMEPGNFETFNIATGKETKVEDIANWFKKVKSNLKFEYNHDKKMYPKRKCADIKKAKEKLGFKPEVEPETGLLKLLNEEL